MDAVISVIIPVYKVENYLDRCVTSVVNQTYRDLDIILVEDGSPDSCPELCDEWAKRDNRIRVVHKVNGGLSSARNAGLDIAAGSYVSFVDSDDWLEPDALETMMIWAQREHCDVVMAGTAKTYDDGTVVNTESHLPARRYTMQEALTSFLYHRDNLAGAVWNKLFVMRFFTGDIPLRFPYGLNSEDYYMFARIYSSMNAMYFNSKPLYHYCVRDDSICTTTEIGMHTFDKITVSDEVCNYLMVRNYADDDALTFFRMQARRDVLFDLVAKNADTVIIRQYRDELRRYIKTIYDNPAVSAIEKLKLRLFSLMPQLYYRHVAGR